MAEDQLIMRRTVDRQAAEARPDLIWNAFVDLVAMEEYTSLSDVQRQGHLVFWYESEVQNGGHLQFFLNRGTDLLNETVASLEATGLPCQAAVLRRAADRWLVFDREDPDSAEEFVEAEFRGEFAGFDEAFHQCSPRIQEALELHLERHRDEYVVLA